MKMREKIKKIKWLLEHQKEIEDLLKNVDKAKTSDFSVGGVPEFQKEYVQELLKSLNE